VATQNESAIDPLAGGKIAVTTGAAMPEVKSPQALIAGESDPLLDSPVTHPESSAKPVSGDALESPEQPAVDQSFASLPNSVRELGDGDLGELPAIEPASLDTLDPGMFLVDPNSNGQVSVRYVFDGGQLTSQVALVSWSGMDRFETLQDVMQEALRRAASNSALGFIAIDDRTEGAMLSDATLEGADFNQGAVAATPKTMQMRPGDRLVALAVNHGMIADLLASGADLTGANRPIFSLSSLNPQGRFSRDTDYFVDVTGRGQTFGLEDLRMDRGRSDQDLNDIVFAIEGATGKAPLLAEAVNPARNWLDTELGQAIVELDRQLFESVAVGNGPLDLTTQLPGDRLPPAEAPRPVIIHLAAGGLVPGETVSDRAERVERMIDTISPDSPAVTTAFGFGGAGAGSPSLAETLKANSSSGLPPVVVLDLDTLAGQTNRIQETLELLLARQVTVVISAGDGGQAGLPAGLPAELPAGVIVVGAVQPSADGAIERSPSSNYGPGLTLMADGREPNPDGSLSDRSSTLIAAGRVAGAIAELKAANPDLSPRQISTILQQTARDLYGAGPDLDSGSGLLNFPAALNLAERTLGDAVDGSQNLPPAPPRFDVHGFYNAGDPIQFQGLARDFDGVADLDRVEFVLVNQVTGDRQPIGTAEQFRPTGETGTTGRFRLNIEELPPGRYELEGRTIDAMGLSSVLLSEAFTVLARSATTAPLPSSVLRAIEAAAQLDRYDRTDLEATRNWIAGLQPGAAPAAVAARLGADLVESGLIPGSYVFRFPDNLTPEAIQARLQADPDVQFAYPLVPIGVELFGREHLELTQTLEVWGSNGAASSSLGDLARASTGYTGEGSVVAIVDDGVQINHPNFLDPNGQNRYRSDLDWDYAANDTDPSPSDENVTIASATPSDGKTINGSTAFAIPTLVPWTGIINGGSISVNADFEQLNSRGLRLNLYVPPAGSSLDPSNRRGSLGRTYSAWSPGWGGGSSPKVEAINSPNQDFDKALGEVAGGFWELRLEADPQRGYTAEQLRDFAAQFIRGYQLTLDLESTHGTSVAGVAAASPDPQDPSERAVGAAPDADLVGVRLTANAQSYINPLTVAKALGHRADLVDVFNNSWGTEEFASSPELLWSLSATTQAGAASQVMAAGNEGDRPGTPGNVNARLLTTNREAIVVGAIDLNGAIESYSTPGANVTLVAPIPDQTTDNEDPNRGLLGSNPNDSVTSFGEVDGTSVAAPLVSGVVALMQEAYGATSGGKELSARDVKHILIATADPTVTANYANNSRWSGDPSSPLRHHPRYGFGVVDAATAVAMAEQWGRLGWTLGNFATNPTATTGVVTEDQEIPKDADTWLQIPIDLDSLKTGAIEDLALTLTIQNPSADLEVELVAPDGTVSAMGNFVHARDSEGQPIAKQSSEAIEWTFGSVRHWGSELSTSSTWTLRLRDPEKAIDDELNDSRPASKLLSYELNVYTNQPTVSLQTLDGQASESGDPAIVRFARSGGDLSQPLTVQYGRSGTATNADLQTPLTGTVTIPAGQPFIDLPIVALDDSVYEPGGESMILQLANSPSYQRSSANSQGGVLIADNDVFSVPLNHWNARYINGITGAANVAYDFSNPVARQDLGNQSGNVGDDDLRLSLNMTGSPAPGVAADNFAMQAWTRKTFEAGQLYRINTQSSDSVRFRLYDRQTNEWIGDNLAYQGDNAHWRNDGASTTSPERTIFFKVPETGEYDFYVEARDSSGAFDIDVQVSAHQPESVTVDTTQEWQSVVYWWDRRTNEPGLGYAELIPATDFFQWSGLSANEVETFSAGSNLQPNGQPGLRLDWEDRAINNDWSLPDNNFAILNQTQATLESGVFYQASVRADDGFQIWMDNPNLPVNDPDRTIYVTPEDTWQYAYQAAPETFYFTVPETAEYEVFAGFYEVWGNARLELDWEPVTVTGQVIATIGANIRSSPNRNFTPVGLLNYGDDVTFDRWVTGEFVAYPELRTATDRWYRIAGTNNWVSGSVLSNLP
jgi:subtilisin family serine protease